MHKSKAHFKEQQFDLVNILPRPILIWVVTKLTAQRGAFLFPMALNEKLSGIAKVSQILNNN